MIGFFDSGFGWLKTMKDFKKLYPEYNYIFLADSKNCPYGEKSWEEIQKLTFKALDWLFGQWAKIIILACNTAAAYSVRKWQETYPEKKVLSITIPWIEKLIKHGWLELNIWVIATEATIMSNIYNDLFSRFGGKPNLQFQFVMAPKIVEIIEEWFGDEKENLNVIKSYLVRFPKNVEHLILWCTHFPVLMKEFKKLFKWEIIDPSKESAKKFGPYLKKHPEVESKISRWWKVKFFTTWDKENFERIGKKIWGDKIDAKCVEI